MLFLLNKQIVPVETPEVHLSRFWKRLGCGDPANMLASDAVNFAVMLMNEHIHDGIELTNETAVDLASLIISKTGANAALFTGTNDTRLNVLPELVLEGLQRELGEGGNGAADELWVGAA